MGGAAFWLTAAAVSSRKPVHSNARRLRRRRMMAIGLEADQMMQWRNNGVRGGRKDAGVFGGEMKRGEEIRPAWWLSVVGLRHGENEKCQEEK